MDPCNLAQPPYHTRFNLLLRAAPDADRLPITKVATIKLVISSQETKTFIARLIFSTFPQSVASSMVLQCSHGDSILGEEQVRLWPSI
jgi:hypothetical protein